MAKPSPVDYFYALGGALGGAMIGVIPAALAGGVAAGLGGEYWHWAAPTAFWRTFWIAWGVIIVIAYLISLYEDTPSPGGYPPGYVPNIRVCCTNR